MSGLDSQVRVSWTPSDPQSATSHSTAGPSSSQTSQPGGQRSGRMVYAFSRPSAVVYQVVMVHPYQTQAPVAR